MECPAVEGVANPDELITISGGEGYGCSGWSEGQTIRNRWRERNNGPEYLTVVSAGSQYHREEGMSFGVGEDQGYVYWAQCRPATDEESAPLIVAQQQREERKRMRARVEAIGAEICKAGECPPGPNRPEGDVLFDTQNIYGGGDWFVVGEEWIWYIQNNGMDGDDWSRNNVSTGGAGAIGWRVPATEQMANELRMLADRLSESKEGSE